jgi:flagellar biosynthetic protein FlhB
MAEQEQNRTEPATPFKLREAKKRGQVAKSLEITSFFMLMTALVVLAIWGDTLVDGQLKAYHNILDHAASVDFAVPHLFAWFKVVASYLVSVLSPLFIALLVVAAFANLVQTGPIFTFFPLKPDMQRLNPVAGFKRLFSMKLLFESLKSVIKLAVFGAIVYFVIVGLIPRLLGMMAVHPVQYPALLLEYIAQMVFKLAMAILLIAFLDFAYTRWDYANKMKMSSREVKDEVKRREGDPHVRARIRELQSEALKRSKALGRVPDADVLITNPNHLAVALLYKRGEMAAPHVIAKGAGELALKMKMVARKHAVPVVENKPLARRLFKKADLDSAIPEALFPVVARLLAWVYAARRAPGEESRVWA